MGQAKGTTVFIWERNTAMSTIFGLGIVAVYFFVIFAGTLRNTRFNTSNDRSTDS